MRKACLASLPEFLDVDDIHYCLANDLLCEVLGYDIGVRKLVLQVVHKELSSKKVSRMLSEHLSRRETEDGFLTFLGQNGTLDDISQRRLSSALEGSGQSVDIVVLELGLLEEIKLADAMAQYLGYQRIGPDEFASDANLETDVPQDFLSRFSIVPLSEDQETITIATARPLEDAPLRALGYFVGKRPIIKVAVASELSKRLAYVTSDDRLTLDQLQSSDVLLGDVERLRDIASEAPIIRLLSKLIRSAVDRNASDIHIELLEDHVRVRYRIDGALQTIETFERNIHLGLISRIKILAHLNIAEQRLPQDGRIRVAVKGRDIDLRVATTPTLHGENAVLRILDRRGLALDFAELGYDTAAIKRFKSIFSAPNGVVLVTGPTGSGKTTTLYAALTSLNSQEAKIFTVEDPIEYDLKGINQILVRPQIGLDFADVLRSVLRQDPDIIMVGEIRDTETAKIAIQASLTGHLVLSTLHTNSAAASITRLRNMGTEDFLIASTVRAIIAQRLVRKICNAHRGVEREAQCPICNGTGYAGRTVIFEILEFTDLVKAAVTNGASDAEIEKLARNQGMLTLGESGQLLVERGETSAAEILRALGNIQT
jgi:general secretion pathway protein E